MGGPFEHRDRSFTTSGEAGRAAVETGDAGHRSQRPRATAEAASGDRCEAHFAFLLG